MCSFMQNRWLKIEKKYQYSLLQNTDELSNNFFNSHFDSKDIVAQQSQRIFKCTHIIGKMKQKFLS